MTLFAVERPVHEFHLGHAPFHEKQKLCLHQLQTPETHGFVDGGKAVAAGKRAAPAALIIYDSVLQPFKPPVGKGNVIQVHERGWPCAHDFPAFRAENQPRNAGELLLPAAGLVPSGQAGECLLALASHDAGNPGKLLKHLPGIVGDLRAAQPDRRVRQDLFHIPRQPPHSLHVPYITGEA